MQKPKFAVGDIVMTPTPAPKFKVGDKVLWMESPIVHEIVQVVAENGKQPEYELTCIWQSDLPEWALEEELRYA